MERGNWVVRSISCSNDDMIPFEKSISFVTGQEKFV
jgi:hypothetical protein